MSGSEDDISLLAAEYALGTLDLAEMREAEALSARDPGFAAEIVFWQDKLSPMAAIVAPVTPPPVLWSRIALATGIGAEPRRSAFGGKGLWQGTTVAALALAASFAFVAFLPQTPVPAAQAGRFAAALAPPATPAQFLALAQPDGSIVLTSLTGVAAPQGHDYELWELPRGATAPVSLGVLTPGQKVVTPPDRPLAQTQLLVSDEPAGGSKTGAPTGPVVFGGALTPLSPASAPGR